MKSRLEELMRERNVPGAVFGVLSGGETNVVAAGVLNRNTGVETTTDSLFQIGSTTKTYTATLVMQLVDEGRVDLDAPVRSYVPEFRIADPDHSDRITVRHLLTHSSGIQGDVFADTGRGDDCLSKFLDVVADLPPHHEPSETMSYSNAGYSILGRVIEVVTDQVWDAVLKERLFEPLGLASSVTLPEEALLYRVAVGHAGPPGTDPEVVPRWVMARSGGPAGRICSSIGDLLAFARMHLEEGRASDGTQVLSPASVKAMQEPQVEVPDRYTLGSAWGLGWIVFGWHGRKLIGHDGTTLGQNAFLKVVPDAGVALALMVNGGNAHGLYRALFAEVLEDVAGVTMPARPTLPATPPPVDLAPYEGTYERLNVRIELKAYDGCLAGTLTYEGALRDIARKPVIEIQARPVDAEVFMFESPDTPEASPMVFYAFDETGRPAFMHVGARAMRHVG